MTEDALALRDAVRSLLLAGRPEPAPADRLDRVRWQRLAEAGVLGVRIAEDAGGTGLGIAEEAIVHEETGRSLTDLPVLSTVGLALPVLAATGAADLLQQAVAGELVVAAAGLLDERPAPAAVADDGGVRVTGVLEPVLDAPVADLLLLGARLDGDEAVVAVPLPGEGVTVAPLPALDLTRTFGRVELSAAPATVLARGPEATAALAAGRTGGALALAADSLGAARRILDLTLDYVRIRVQFGRTIGSFQAVKHRCADMYVELERATSALELGLLAAVDPDSPALAAARVACGRAGRWIADESLHLFGGIGYTWEHPAHLYLRRATSNQLLLDAAGDQRRQIAARVTAQLRGEAVA